MSSGWTATYDLWVVNLRAQSCWQCFVVPLKGRQEEASCLNVHVYVLSICVRVGSEMGSQWAPLRWVFVWLTVIEWLQDVINRHAS